MSLSIYVEGGGIRDRDVNARCREGFSEYFKRVAPDKPRPKIIACGGRAQTFQKFMTAIQIARNNEVCAMLVDSESAPTYGHSPKQHLEAAPDRWNFADIDSPAVFLMVQAMEAWLLADRSVLSAFYEQGFRLNALPGTERDVESIRKADLEPSLINATRDTTKGRYDKSRHAFALLARIDPAKVERGSRFARDFHEFLRNSG